MVLEVHLQARRGEERQGEAEQCRGENDAVVQARGEKRIREVRRGGERKGELHEDSSLKSLGRA